MWEKTGEVKTHHSLRVKKGLVWCERPIQEFVIVRRFEKKKNVVWGAAARSRAVLEKWERLTKPTI